MKRERTRLDELDELSLLIMLFVAIIFLAAVFGNNYNYRRMLQERVKHARELVREVDNEQARTPDNSEL